MGLRTRILHGNATETELIDTNLFDTGTLRREEGRNLSDAPVIWRKRYHTRRDPGAGWRCAEVTALEFPVEGSPSTAVR